VLLKIVVLILCMCVCVCVVVFILGKSAIGGKERRLYRLKGGEVIKGTNEENQ
jgi:hypothetical protein